MSEQIDQHTRLFARVEDNLPVRLRVLSQERASQLSRSYYGVADAAREHEGDAPRSRPNDPLLHEVLGRLQRLEEQVARIARSVGAADDDGAWIEGETISLSGAGLGVSLPEPLPEDGVVEVELTLPSAPAAVIRATARVASVSRPGEMGLPFGRWQAGLGFTGISSADREALVRHSFRLQRAMLRERKSEGP